MIVVFRRGAALCLLFLVLSSAACAPTRSLSFVEAVEIPQEPGAAGDLTEILQTTATRDGLFFQDASAHMDAATNHALTSSMIIYRPLGRDREWPEIQVHAEHGGPLWVLFLEAADQDHLGATSRTRDNVLADLRRRWPGLRKVPILPHGGVPLRDDLQLTPDGYKLAREKAKAYELPPNSPLVANGSFPERVGD
jgi:hypothetical protein